jgi:hypothetical protein
MAFIKFVLVFVAIYYIAKVILKGIMQYLVSGAMNNLKNKQTYEHDAKPEGEITIQQTHKVDKKLDKNIGEYVDYENVD